MAKSRLSTINDTINYLKSLKMQIPSDLLAKKDEEETLMIDQKIETSIDRFETMTMSALAGIPKHVSIKIHYDQDAGVKVSYTTSDYPIKE